MSRRLQRLIEDLEQLGDKASAKDKRLIENYRNGQRKLGQINTTGRSDGEWNGTTKGTEKTDEEILALLQTFRESRSPYGPKDETIVHPLIPIIKNNKVVGYRRRKYAMWEILTLYKRADGKCQICGKDVGPTEASIDHMIPLSQGGLDTLSNLRFTHFFCNASKNRRKVSQEGVSA